MPTHLEADIEHRNWYLNERKYYQAGIIGSCVNTVPRIPQRYRKRFVLFICILQGFINRYNPNRPIGFCEITKVLRFCQNLKDFLSIYFP